MSSRSKISGSILGSNSEELRSSPEKAQAPVIREISEAERRKKAERNSRLYIWCVIGVSVALAAFIILRGVVNINEQLTGELSIYNIDISGAPDGVYEGSFTSAHMSAAVSVEIRDGRMTAIQLDSYTGIDPQRARTVFDSIVEHHTVTPPDDDIGSQYTDRIAQRAVMEALSEAAEYTARSEASQQQGETVPYVSQAPTVSI